MASGAEMSSSLRTKRPFFPKKQYKNVFPDKKNSRNSWKETRYSLNLQ